MCSQKLKHFEWTIDSEGSCPSCFEPFLLFEVGDFGVKSLRPDFSATDIVGFVRFLCAPWLKCATPVAVRVEYTGRRMPVTARQLLEYTELAAP